MNSTKNLFAPVQRVFATLAIFALVLGSFAFAPFAIAASGINSAIITPNVGDTCQIAGTELTINGNATAEAEPGQLVQYHVLVDWGDGTINNQTEESTFSIGENPDHGIQSRNFSDTHTFAAAGTYTISVKIYHSKTPGNDNQADDVATIQICIVPPPTTGTITIDKTVVTDDNNGPETADSFTYKIDGNVVNEGVAVEVTAGPHALSEDAFEGYTASVWSGACAADGSINVVAGENYTCNITNDDNAVVVNPGTIIVDKVTVPSGNVQSFSFTTTGTGYAGFALTDAATANSQQLEAGTYSVSEESVTGWTKTSATCSDGSDPSSISLSADEVVTCTFTNTLDTGSLTILKQTNDVTGATVPFDFQLDSNESTFEVLGNNSDSESFVLPAGSHTVSELTETGWDFGSVSCDVPSNEGAKWNTDGSFLSVNIAKGDDITCTYSNTKEVIIPELGSITLDKVVTSGDQGLQFSFGTWADTATMLSGADAPVVFNNLSAGSYAITEQNIPAGYSLDDISCVAGDVIKIDTVGDDTDGQITFALAAGEDVTCTFTNSRDTGTLRVVKEIIGNTSATPDLFSFIVNDGSATAFEVDGSNDIVVDTGTYTVAEVADANFATVYNNCTDVAVAKGTTTTCTVTNRLIETNDNDLSCSFVTNDSSVSKGQEFTLSWDTANATQVSIDNGVGNVDLDGSLETSVNSDTLFTLTASRYVGEEVLESIDCQVNIDVRSGGGGGGGSRRTPSNDEPEGEVLGAATSTLPVGAPNTGAGSTSPISVSLPSLVAILGSRTRMTK